MQKLNIMELKAAIAGVDAGLLRSGDSSKRFSEERAREQKRTRPQ